MTQHLGIDFGTSNTYLSTTTQGGQVQALPLNVGGDGAAGISTVIMYRESGELKGQHLIGELAVQRYGGASPRRIADNGLRFVSNFKPDIVTSKEAREDALFFLRSIRSSLSESHIQIEDGVEVYIGVPSEASDEFCETLKQIAKEAGYGKVHLLHEPVAALLDYHAGVSGQNEILRIFNENVLVVDFGGGTCDFCILQNGIIKASWGDMFLGGRILDDLFYQWFLEQTQEEGDPVTDQMCIDNRRNFYYMTVRCRIMKEKFSNLMKDENRRKSPFEDFFAERWSLSMPWDGFLERAKRYEPSQSFLNLAHLSGDLSRSRFAENKPIDLFQWFEDELRHGFDDEECKINFKDIQMILLTGGSSCWVLVSDLCKKIFPEAKVIRSNDPMAAISMGLAKYALLKEEARGKIDELERDKGAFVDKAMDSIRGILIDQDLVDSAINKVFDTLILPKIDKYKLYGGTMGDLEKELKEKMTGSQSEVGKLLNPVFKEYADRLNATFEALLSEWFNEHHVDQQLYSLGCNTTRLPSLDKHLEELCNNYNPDVGFIWERLARFIATILYGVWIAILNFFTDKQRETINLRELSPQEFQDHYTPEYIEQLRVEKFKPQFEMFFSSSRNTILDGNQGVVVQAVNRALNEVLEEYRRIIKLER